MNTTTKGKITTPPEVVVIGAGLSGLVCAQELSQNGVNVQLLEQSLSLIHI